MFGSRASGAAAAVDASTEDRLALFEHVVLHGDQHQVDQALAVLLELQRREEWAQAILSQVDNLVIVVDADGRITWSSPSVERILGFKPEEVVGRNGFELLHDDDVDPAAEALSRVRPPEQVDLAAPPIVIRVRQRCGGYRSLSVQGTNLLGNPAVEGVVLSARDITELQAADQALLDESALLEGMAKGESLVGVLERVAELVTRTIPGAVASVGVIDRDGVIRHPAARGLPAEVVRLLDAGPADGELGRAVRGGRGAIVFPDLRSDPRWGALPDLLTAQGLVTCWCWPVLEPGTANQLGLLSVFLDEDRAPHPSELPTLARAEHLAAIAIQRANIEARLAHQALHDSLTGLPNRTLLLDRIGEALASAQEAGEHIAVLFIDLDRFKVVNDSMGHAAGDDLLLQVARRFATAVRRGDTVGRFGGDEFVVCARVDDVQDARNLADRLLHLLDEPIVAGGAEMFATCSIGIAMSRPDGLRDPQALVRDADAEMYQAKDLGRNQAAVFETHLHRRMVRRMQVERDLRAALTEGRLVAHYQPRVALRDGHTTGVEALLRWERPGHGLVGADQVIPVAEETGLIVPIGAWMLQEACREAASWTGAHSELPISVNISARQLAEPDLVELVARTLRDTSLPPERLCLEITESALAADPDQSVVLLGALKLIGVRLSIDDFGTGYSTLDYVRRFSMADELKIDRSFVEGVADCSRADSAIVSAVIVLADALGLETVAEGVEDREQVDVLRKLGCGHAQGFYFARPVPAEGLHELPLQSIFDT
jgi:diguanylate cyclase (GGDEF)-like protein/PAS domain S-box-containing protein